MLIDHGMTIQTEESKDRRNAIYDIKSELNKRINRQRIVSDLKTLIGIRSVNPAGSAVKDGTGEQEIAEHYAREMRRIGMDIQVDEVAEGRVNVFGRLHGLGTVKPLMLVGHLDTVDGDEDQFQAYDDGQRVYGRGACDMKASLAVYLEVARIVAESGLELKGDLIVGGVCDEEFEMTGSRYVGANGPSAGQCIIGEPTELWVAPSNKGQLCLLVRAFGKAVHSSVPEEGINAIEMMMKALEALQGYHKTLRARVPDPRCGTASFNAGVIRGGMMASAVPDFCEVEIDRRLLPGETKEQVYDELRAILDRIGADDPFFRYELSEPTFDVSANTIAEEEPVVQSLLDSFVENTGLERRTVCLPYGTDAPNMGMPTVICGPGSISQAHGKNEYCDIDQMEKAARMYLAAVVDLLL